MTNNPDQSPAMAVAGAVRCQPVGACRAARVPSFEGARNVHGFSFTTRANMIRRERLEFFYGLLAGVAANVLVVCLIVATYALVAAFLVAVYDILKARS